MLFVSVPLIMLALFADKVPVIPETLGADHEYVVPVGTMFPAPLVGVKENEFEEQIV